MYVQSLQGKKAILTGGAQGLGLALVHGLCKNGVEVCIIDYSDQVHTTVKDLKNMGFKASAVQADLSQLANIPEVFHLALQNLNGELDILVNNAGIHKPMPATELPIADFQKIIDVNVTAIFELCRLSYAEMKKKGKGKIVNIASVLSIQGGYNASAYSASKGAVAQLTKSLSNEWSKDGINVNAIAPGYFKTPLNQFIFNDPERSHSILDRIPTGRFGEPEELAGALLFLSSDQSNYVNGILLPVDGGFLGR
ncbi:SDR family NAD(P)-dependent oxidoreductase [Lysinibacillus endophyticus]|uniref:SDR family NAD(P)-dependent oxidoreductase n=1 Tax=Ureibacillus endophyticus TaxID=1978490 RepID=UPI00209FB933|nr:glucose 1-dehydrogenase [Lysinibacillus endophyticus]MCP1146732.1 glucose 1-dehydrogenase [Lysinibacillus endophyticus]